MAVHSFTIEYQTANGDWRLTHGGRQWKTKAGADRAAAKWIAEEAKFDWHPAVRVIPLELSYNVRGVSHLRAAA